ncbi:hypothetical protein GJ744_004193 [Endocarpon pusillum]|uniref:Uncharacterized protein n=1 Tax=Endocarpon pusillum TaxID=364733 RepID=A0A8H7E1P3_9EURO|nr:hypothetical protein GJ744_004193 [Endocarpon pusillum]
MFSNEQLEAFIFQYSNEFTQTIYPMPPRSDSVEPSSTLSPHLLDQNTFRSKSVLPLPDGSGQPNIASSGQTSREGNY